MIRFLIVIFILPNVAFSQKIVDLKKIEVGDTLNLYHTSFGCEHGYSREIFAIKLHTDSFQVLLQTFDEFIVFQDNVVKPKSEITKTLNSKTVIDLFTSVELEIRNHT